LDYDRGRGFLSKLENPAMVYHKDADGVCSAVVLQELVKSAAHPNDGPGIQLSEGLLESLKEGNSVVFLDIPIDQLQVVENLKDRKIFVLDHHPPERDLTSENILHMNPRFEDEDAYLPTSYLSYKLLGSRSKQAWKAAVGVIGDHGVKGCEDLFEDVGSEYPETIEKGITYNSLKESKLGLIADMIDASKAVRGLDGIRRSFEVMKDAREPNDVLDTELKEFYEVYRREIERAADDFRRNSEYFPRTNSYLYELSSRYSIGSDLSTELSNENPDAVVIVYQIEDYGMKISGRCQSGRVDVSKIIKGAVKDFGSGGGHPQAAGGFVESGKEELALERFREKLEGID